MAQDMVVIPFKVKSYVVSIGVPLDANPEAIRSALDALDRCPSSHMRTASRIDTNFLADAKAITFGVSVSNKLSHKKDEIAACVQCVFGRAGIQIVHLDENPDEIAG